NRLLHAAVEMVRSAKRGQLEHIDHAQIIGRASRELRAAPGTPGRGARHRAFPRPCSNTPTKLILGASPLLAAPVVPKWNRHGKLGGCGTARGRGNARRDPRTRVSAARL